MPETVIVPAVFTVIGIEMTPPLPPGQALVPFNNSVELPAKEKEAVPERFPPTLKLNAPFIVAFPVSVSEVVQVQSEAIVKVTAPSDIALVVTAKFPDIVQFPATVVVPVTVHGEEIVKVKAPRDNAPV